MSKRIISAILTVALVASLFTMVFVAPASAAETYTKKVEAIKTAVENVLVKGILVSNDMLAKLNAAGLISYDKDNAKYPVLSGRKAAEDSYYISDAGKFVADLGAALEIVKPYMRNYAAPTTPLEAVETILQFAIYAYTFGQEADTDLVDAKFNEARAAIYDKAVSALDKVIAAYKAQVAADVKPASYEALWKEYYFFATKGYYYNASYGINPYYFLNEIDNMNYDQYYKEVALANYFNTLDVYGTQIAQLGDLSAIKWYSFEEIRANSAWAEILARFEKALRNSLGNKCAGVLYYDFIDGAYADVVGTFKELCKAIVGSNELANSAYTKAFDVSAQAKAFTKLKAVYEIYALYVKDVFNNLYTSATKALALDALKAARLIEFVADDPLKVLALDAASVNALADAIIADLDDLTPVFGQPMSAAEVDEGNTLVMKADALLAAFPQTDANKATRNALIQMRNYLADMLPIEVNGQAVIVIPANKYFIPADGKEYKIATGFTIPAAGNDQILVKFAPTAFVYYIYKARLNAAYKAFLDLVSAWGYSYSAQSAAAGDKSELKSLLSRFAFLTGYAVAVDGDGKAWYNGEKVDDGYFYALTGMTYEEFAALALTDVAATSFAFEKGFYCDIFGNLAAIVNVDDLSNPSLKDDAFDAATRNFINFFNVMKNAANVYQTGVYNKATSIDVSNGNHNFETGDPLIYFYDYDSNIYANAVASIKSALKYLTADMTKVILKMRYIADDIMNFFELGVKTNAAGAFYNTVYAEQADAAADGLTRSIPANYPNKYFANFLSVFNAFQLKLARYTTDKDANFGRSFATEQEILSAYEAMIAQLKTLLTDKGDACLDAYLADIDDVANIKFGGKLENGEQIYNKLTASGVALTLYFPVESYIRGYEYYAFTLKSVALSMIDASELVGAASGIYGNKYAMVCAGDSDKTLFELNYYNKLKAAADAVAAINNGAYSREATQKAVTLAKLASDVLAMMILPADGVDGDVKIDMPVWYAEKFVEALNQYVADFANEKVTALASKKAAELDPLVALAQSLNIANYNVSTDEYKTIWANFAAAYEAARNISFDKYASQAEINAAVEALQAALDKLENIKKATEGTDDLQAAIASAKAMIKYAKGSKDVSAIEIAIAKIEKKLAYDINIIAVDEKEALLNELNAAVAALGYDYADSYADGKFASKYFQYINSVYGAEYTANVDGKYTEASFAAFDAAYQEAKAIAKTEGIGYDAILDSKKAFDAAHAALEIYVEPAPVEPVRSFTYKTSVSTYNYYLSQLNALDASKYTAESYNAFVESLQALADLIEKSANDQFLQDALVNVNVAFNLLAEPAPAPVVVVPEVKTLDA